MSTRERLEALLAEAGAQTVYFEKRRRKRRAFSRALQITIAVTAMLVGIGSSTAAPQAVTTTLATVLLIASMLNLTVSETERDHHVQQIAIAWEHHWTVAARLLSREQAKLPASMTLQVERDTNELEVRVAETRTRSMLHGIDCKHPESETAAAGQSQPDSETA